VLGAIEGAKIKLGMKRLFLHVAVVITTLVTASGQCVARCATGPCHETPSGPAQADQSNVPPCHGHQSKKQAPPSTPCQLTFQAAVKTPDIVKPEIARGDASLTLIAGHVSTIAAERWERVVTGNAPPPLLSAYESPDVLRI
jgi:hypothetical protein